MNQNQTDTPLLPPLSSTVPLNNNDSNEKPLSQQQILELLTSHRAQNQTQPDQNTPPLSAPTLVSTSTPTLDEVAATNDILRIVQAANFLTAITSPLPFSQSISQSQDQTSQPQIEDVSEFPEEQTGLPTSSKTKRKPHKRQKRENDKIIERITNTPLVDEYKWRKYGKKALKGSQHPRDYFKCSVTGCTAKKQLEKIIENGELKFRYVYVGEHSHPPPHSSRTLAADQASFKAAVISAFSKVII
jgi:hypothetical protein